MGGKDTYLLEEVYARTAPSKGAIWTNLPSEKNQNQSIKKHTKYHAKLAHFWCKYVSDSMHILVGVGHEISPCHLNIFKVQESGSLI